MKFDNDTHIKENISYLKEIFFNKLKGSFSWGEFSLYLNAISKNTDITALVQKDYDFALKIEAFIIATDCLDDLMDGDNPSFNALADPVCFTRKFINYSLRSIYDCLDSLKTKELFTHTLRKSLSAQEKDIKNKLTLNSSEMDYFTSGIDRSVYLLYAIVQISAKKKQKDLFAFSYFFAASNQLKNDLANIISDSGSDLWDRKATLPVIKGLEAARHGEPKIFRYFINYFVHSDLSYFDHIRKFICDSGAIEYCQYVSNQCKKESYRCLNKSFPNSESVIEQFYHYIS